MVMGNPQAAISNASKRCRKLLVGWFGAGYWLLVYWLLVIGVLAIGENSIEIRIIKPPPNN